MLIVNGVLALLVDVNDHTTGLGLLSEVTAGAAFLAGALTLALVPISGRLALLGWLAPAGLAIAGLTQCSG